MTPVIPPPGQWCVYLLECRGGELYCGISNDLNFRLQRHWRGDGSKYVFGRKPFTLMWVEEHPDKSSALRREAAIKKLPTKAKRKLVQDAMKFTQEDVGKRVRATAQLVDCGEVTAEPGDEGVIEHVDDDPQFAPTIRFDRTGRALGTRRFELLGWWHQ